MTAVLWVFVGLVALGVLYWLVNALLVLRIVLRVPILERLQPPEPERWPKLSVIIPARNEAERIEAATRSRLCAGYPNLEVVLVNDRSEDGTGAVVDRLAAADERVRAVHITELSDGWIGKVHAMHRGVQMATGDWLLFSDADVHTERGTLSRALAYCVGRGLDHLAIIPEFWPTTFLLDCALATFVRLICLSARVWAIEDARSTASIGVGAFNLVRRSAFERTGGFEALRLTVVDDVALGQMMKRSGAKCAVLNGRRRVGLQFYRTVGEAARATEKSVLVAFRFSYLRLVAVLLTTLWLELSPILALALLCVSAIEELGGPSGAALIVLGGLAAAGLILALFSSLLINRWAGMRLLPAACFPVGVTLNFFLVARAAILAAWRGGHMWRGTLYPNEVLRAGSDFRFP
jgi:cellulose synthase/poly-beta-1,6-N-acetylglucosamine synthase-like glycosyltransferase